MLGFLFEADVKKTRGRGMWGKEIGKILNFRFFTILKFHLENEFYFCQSGGLFSFEYSVTPIWHETILSQIYQFMGGGNIFRSPNGWVGKKSRNWSLVTNGLFGSNLKFDLSRTDSPVWSQIYQFMGAFSDISKWVSGGKNCSLVTNALFGSNLKFDFDITDRLSGMVPLQSCIMSQIWQIYLC